MSYFPPTEGLLAMLATARLGSLTAAAEELGITHGAVSRRIKAIEFWLGTAVFERHGRGMRLTETGGHFRRRAERAMLSISTFADEVRAERIRHVVRLSVLPSLARLWLLPRLLELQGEPADLAIQPLVEHRAANLQAQEADIAIRLGSGGWPGVDTHLLFMDMVHAAASPVVARRLAGRPVSEWFSETVLQESDGADWRAWCRAADIPYRPKGGERRFVDHDLIVQAARSGLGIALVRQPLASSAFNDGGLVALGGPRIQAERNHYLVARHGETCEPIIRALKRLIELGSRT